MPFFKLKIIERNPKESIDEFGELTEKLDTLEWVNREYGFDTDVKRIESYQSIMVYINEIEQKESVRLEFDNGTYVYLAYSLDKFKANTLPKYMDFIKVTPSDTL